MTRPLTDLPLEELKKLLKRETKAFIDGLEHGLSVPELKSIRIKMKEIAEIIEDKTKRKDNLSNNKDTSI